MVHYLRYPGFSGDEIRKVGICQTHLFHPELYGFNRVRRVYGIMLSLIIIREYGKEFQFITLRSTFRRESVFSLKLLRQPVIIGTLFTGLILFKLIS